MSEQILHFNKKRNYQSVRKDKVVSLTCLMSDADSGENLDYRTDMVYLHGGYGSAFPRIEEALEGKQVDMSCELTLEPEDAYGPADPSLLIKAPAEAIPEAARQVGAVIEGESPDGSNREFHVMAVEDDGITVDGNHPLAGRRVHFKLEITDIRDASAEEIAAGYGFAGAAKQ